MVQYYYDPLSKHIDCMGQLVFPQRCIARYLAKLPEISGSPHLFRWAYCNDNQTHGLLANGTILRLGVDVKVNMCES